ncbi:cyclin-dependent kinases regulatory subunit 1 isoform X1 [Saccopteryx bilineata]|uniref:cyclin-dependent kinases regulatory subunit 1 isoform X1 n=1 Tax=Saccopteryx bilineata TaxID=59482 RepID=UPI00338E9A1E
MSHKQIYYSDKYDDEEFEYRHVMLPKDIAKLVPKTHLMSESEWRNLGVQQSQGWVHYMIHEPDKPGYGSACKNLTSCCSGGHCPRRQRNEADEPVFSLKLYTAVLT